jgi:DNA topoisomerase-1
VAGAARKQVKFDRMREFGRHLPAIRRAVARDLRPGRPQLETVVATIVWLLDCTALRVGNDEYSEANGSFGLTTLRNRHAQVRAGELTLSFKGKSGVAQQARVSDRAVARIVKRCQDLPGSGFFQFVDDEGDVHHVRSEHVNDYIRRICSKARADEADGPDSAKDFRTWHASVYALELAMAATASPAGSRHPGALTFTDLIAEVARRLGSTCTVCPQFYIHPQVLALCEQPGQCPPAATAAPAAHARAEPWNACSWACWSPSPGPAGPPAPPCPGRQPPARLIRQVFAATAAGTGPPGKHCACGLTQMHTSQPLNCRIMNFCQNRLRPAALEAME